MVNSSCGAIGLCTASGPSHSALKASTSPTTSPDPLSSSENESVNTSADSRLDGLIQAHYWKVDSDRWAQVALDLYKPVVPNVIVNASDQNVAICSAGIAFELAIKSLARITGATVTPTHRIEEAYRSLGPLNQRMIRTAVRVHLNWPVSKFFDAWTRTSTTPIENTQWSTRRAQCGDPTTTSPFTRSTSPREDRGDGQPGNDSHWGRYTGRSERPSRLTCGRPPVS